MCNHLLEKNSWHIPEEGIGYKLFYKKTTGRLCPLVSQEKPYIHPNGNVANVSCDTIVWIDKENPSASWYMNYWRKLGGLPRCGFCFFLDLDTAKLAIQHWSRETGVYRIANCKIEYKRGVGEHSEAGMISSMDLDVALCKEFRVIEELR